MSKQIFKIAEMLLTQTMRENYNCYSKLKYLYHFISIGNCSFPEFFPKVISFDGENTLKITY